MAEPAYGGADGPRPEHPEAGRLDPRKRVWADVQETIITCAHAAGLAVTELAHRPDDDPAREMAALTRKAFDRAVVIGQQWVVSEAFLEAERKRAFDEGVEWCKAQRPRLEVIPGG
jgi:hypothetical protein